MKNMKVKYCKYILGKTNEAPFFMNLFMTCGDYSWEYISSMIDKWISI